MRVVIAEDHALLRDGLIRLLTAHGFEVVAAVADGPECCRPLRRTPARTSRSSTSGCRPPSPTRACGRPLAARRELPGLPVLVLSQYVEQLYARDCSPTAPAGSATCSRTGSARSDEFLDAMRRVAAGGTAMDPEVITQLIHRPRRRSTASPRASGRCCA